MTTTKTFSLGEVLSCTTGRLLTQTFSRVHELIEYLAGVPVFTHQLGRVNDELRPHLLSQFPHLADVTASEVTADNFAQWITAQTEIYGDTFEVSPLPSGIEQVDPLAELERMVDPSKIVTVVAK